MKKVEQRIRLEYFDKDKLDPSTKKKGAWVEHSTINYTGADLDQLRLQLMKDVKWGGRFSQLPKRFLLWLLNWLERKPND